jgi:hypothetical protein
MLVSHDIQLRAEVCQLDHGTYFTQKDVYWLRTPWHPCYSATFWTQLELQELGDLAQMCKNAFIHSV